MAANTGKLNEVYDKKCCFLFFERALPPGNFYNAESCRWVNSYQLTHKIQQSEASNPQDFNHVQSHPPPSAYMQRTAAGGGRASAMPQSRGGGFGRNTETARPMTSNRAAGYTAAGKQGAGKAGKQRVGWIDLFWDSLGNAWGNATHFLGLNFCEASLGFITASLFFGEEEDQIECRRLYSLPLATLGRPCLILWIKAIRARPSLWKRRQNSPRKKNFGRWRRSLGSKGCIVR